jgi:hypothetical protein
MDKEIRLKLIEFARLKATCTYSQLNEQLQLHLNFSDASDRSLIGDWLGEISIQEHEKGRPLLSCLVTHKDKMREQGDGFYKLCEGLLGIPWQELKADKEWENNQIAKCFEFWTNPKNYKIYKND